MSNLASGPWLREQEMTASAANWTKVDNAMRAFIGGTFIDTSPLPFGAGLPQDPEWQKQLLKQLAA